MILDDSMIKSLRQDFTEITVKTSHVKSDISESFSIKSNDKISEKGYNHEQ